MEVEEGKTGIYGAEGDFSLGDGHTMKCADILLGCTLET